MISNNIPPTLKPVEYKNSRWPWCDQVQESSQAGGTRTSFPESRSASADFDLPKIVVITPSFNQGEFLEETIRSVLLQDYPHLQYIVVDGGSTDQSNEILDHYEPFIHRVLRGPDEGQSDAICKGLAIAEGQLFNWINSDDRLEPGVLWDLARHYEKSIDLYAYDVNVEDAFGEPPDGFDPSMINANLSAKAMLRADRYSFSQPGLWFRMDHLKACGGIDRSLNYGFDWDLIVRYLARFPKVSYRRKPGAMFRLHEQSKTIVETSKSNDQENRFKQEQKRIRSDLESSLPPALTRASKLGRRREPWHQSLVDLLDQRGRSPLALSCGVFRDIWQDPRARCSTRSFGAIARLLSRYVRPGFNRPFRKR